MSAAPLLAELRARGACLRLEGDRLRLEAPPGGLPRRLVEAARAQREELLRALGQPASAAPSRPGAIPGSPAAAMERAWRRAVARAREGFGRAAREPAASDLEGASALELAADPQAPVPEADRTRAEARRLLPAIYAGRLVARLGPDGRPRVAQAAEVLDLRRRPSPRRAPRSERTPAELVAEAWAYGFHLEADVRGLRVLDAWRRLPNGEPARGELRIPAPLLRALAERKAEVLAYLEAAGSA